MPRLCSNRSSTTQTDLRAHRRTTVSWFITIYCHASVSCSCVSPSRRTFGRIIDGTKSVMVRFDKEYSYGDEHDAWKDAPALVVLVA